jgi:hypothetical protein
MTFQDTGHQEQLIYNSLGYLTSAPCTVTVQASIGRLSWRSKDNVVLVSGTGKYDRTVVVRGGLINVNRLFGGYLGVGGADDGTGTGSSQIVYSCLIADGCKAGGTDTVTITVNDEGFFGRGGPLTATVAVNVNLV